MSGATIADDLVASHGNGFGVRVVGDAEDPIGQLVERHHPFLTLTLQQTTQTPIFGWCHNERDEPATGRRGPHPMQRGCSPLQPGPQSVVDPARLASPRTTRPLSLAAPGNAANRHGSVLSVPRRCSTTMNSGRDRVKRELLDVAVLEAEYPTYSGVRATPSNEVPRRAPAWGSFIGSLRFHQSLGQESSPRVAGPLRNAT